MDNTVRKGKVTSVNHEKQYASIEYTHNDKKRTITCKIDGHEELREDGKKEKKGHQYRAGDEVSFQIKGADRGSRIMAYNLKFLYNADLEKLLRKADTDNRFTGYLKIVNDELFVKEWDSYLFFPLILSKWENPPVEKAFNEAIEFKLLHLDKPEKLTAELFSHDYIPEFRKAIQHFKNKIEVVAVVSRVSPFAVYLDLFGDKVQSKIQLPAEELAKIKEGDSINVIITYLNNTRIVVERTT